MKNSVSRYLVCATVSLALFGCGGNAPESAEPVASVQPEPAQSATADSKPDSTDANTAVAADIPGEKTYQKTCVLCHGSPGMGAPVLGNKDDWAPRIAQGKDTLYLHAKEGYVGEKGAMPAHGGNPNLDEEALKAAVDYMVTKAQ